MLGDQGGIARPPGMFQNAQGRCEFGRLRPPVEHQRFGGHDQRRAASFDSARFQRCQHLRGLAHAHVVGQAAAEAELAQEFHPSHAFALITAQLTGEPRRLRRYVHAVETITGAPFEPNLEDPTSRIRRVLGIR